MRSALDESATLLEDAARFVSRKGLIKFTRFLDPAEIAAAQQFARTYGCCFSCFGGYDRAERAVGCFHPYDESPSHSEYPLVCLHTSIKNRFTSISHRDLLGAFMALGLTRSCIGDMIIRDTDVYLFAVSSTADFIASALTSAGKMPLDFAVCAEIPEIPGPQGSQMQAVVSSLRLDAVLACAYRLSRNEAAECIRAGLVKVDHLPCERTDFVLKEGALLSIRGKGRIQLSAVNGMTRKQRIGITLFRYE